MRDGKVKCLSTYLCFIFLIAKAKAENDYCSGVPERHHILCATDLVALGTELGNAEICNATTKIPLKEKDKSEFLDTFNGFRKTMALGNSSYFPKEKDELKTSSDMIKLKWNDELQKAAENLLYMCADKPIKPDILTFKDPVSGEITQAKNIQISRNGSDMQAEIQEVYATEASKFTYTDFKNYKTDEKYDMFTIPTYSKAKYMGCARISPWFQSKEQNFTFGEWCLFMPSEKESDNALFTDGPPCSQCPIGFSCSEDAALCDSPTENTSGSAKPEGRAANVISSSKTDPSLAANVINSSKTDLSPAASVINSSKTDPSPAANLINSSKTDPSQATNKVDILDVVTEDDLKESLLYSDKFCAYDNILCDSFDTKRGAVKNESCSKNKQVKLSEEDKNFIVKISNKQRQLLALGESSMWDTADEVKINITAADMIELEWDSVLEKAAEKIMFYTCYSGNRVNSSQIRFGPTGMEQARVYYLHYVEDFKERSLQGSYDEQATIFTENQQNIKNYTHDSRYNLFTVTSFAKSRYIGCARMKPSYVEMTNREDHTTDVCLLASSEEEKDNRLFLQGPPCSLCPQNCSQVYRGLCKGHVDAPVAPPLPEYALEPIYKHDDYCSEKPEHILCPTFKIGKFESKTRSKCGEVKRIYFTKLEKAGILSSYNKFRSLVAQGKYKSENDVQFPSAADMMQLEWDNDLQHMAERILYVCSDWRFIQKDQMAFGKNWTVLTSDIYPFHNMTFIEGRHHISKIIFDQEAKLFPVLYIKNYTFKEQYDMFTVISYAKSRYVGCARIQPMYKLDFKYQWQVGEACLLMPSENNLGNQWNRLYLEGPTCSRCPKGSKCSVELGKEGLCETHPDRLGGLGINDNYCILHYQHVMCDTWWSRNSKLCRGKTPVKITEKRMPEILHVYNSFRTEIATGQNAFLDKTTAANMTKLQWDYELQSAAERMLHNCSNKNLIFRNGDMLKFGANGEVQGKAFSIVYNNTDLEAALKAVLEKQGAQFDKTKFDSYSVEKKFEIFSALAFSEAHYIGCSEMTPSHLTVKGDVVQFCVIAPAENPHDNRLFQKGKICTKCRPNYYCEEGLCKAASIGIERPDDYCKVNTYHILCHEWEDEEMGDPALCKDKEPISLSENKSLILDKYNNFRAEIAKGSSPNFKGTSKAADMVELEWDKQLQQAAENILFSCVSPDKIRPENLTFGRHGELQANAIFLYHNETNFEEVFDAAIKKEAGFFNSENRGNYSTSGTYDMFTSSAFSRARYLGCARQTPSNVESTLVAEVCVIGATESTSETNKLYAEGDPCSQCPHGFTCSPDNPMLCRGPLHETDESRIKRLVDEKPPPPPDLPPIADKLPIADQFSIGEPILDTLADDHLVYQLSDNDREHTTTKNPGRGGLGGEKNKAGCVIGAMPPYFMLLLLLYCGTL